MAQPSDHYIDVDNRYGAALATQYLVDHGRTAIATIAGPPDMPAAVDREQGWRDAMRGAGLLRAPHRRTATSPRPAASGPALALVDAHPDLDAIFVASDLMASGVMLALDERGLRVPEDVALVGFDNSRYATRGRVGLTTISQPAREMGVVMADTLLRLLAGEQVEQVTLLDTHLVERDSV